MTFIAHPAQPLKALPILIVEDDDAQRHVLADLVADEGFQPVVCATAAEALEHLANNDFPVAIVDQLLPDMTGVELLKRTGGHHRGVRVILYTGYGSFESARDAVNLGAFAYVEKLSDTRQLLSQVHRAVQHYMAQALKESEQRYRTIVEQIPAVTYLLSPDCPARLLYLSPQVQTLLGASPQSFCDDPAGLLDAVHPDDRQRIDDLRRHCLADQRAFAAEYRLLAADGRVVWVRDGATPVKDATGRTLYHHGVMMDITESQQVAEQAAQRQTQLEHVLRVATIGEMATALAHELNQPFAAISNFAEACSRRLRDGDEPADRLLPIIEDIAQQANRAGRIIRRLRDFVRNRPPRRQPADLNRIIHHAADLFAAEARAAGVPVRLDLADGLPAVLVDEIQIEQVLLNLMRNGLEACGDRPGRDHYLQVTSRRETDGQVRATVEDTGPGLSAEQRRLAFQPFYSTKPGGLGMGLAICHTMIQLNHGRLWLDASDRGGCAACLALPAEPPAASADRPA